MVAYNSQRFLGACLDSIREHAPHDASIIMVDNGSTDASVDLVRERYPDVQVTLRPDNPGFAIANNAAAGLARGDILLLLNPDTVLLDDIQPALDFLRAEPSAAVLSIQARNADSTYQPSSGNFPSAVRLIKLRWQLRPEPETMDPGEVDWVQGSFLMTTRANWDALAGLDESFFMYAEDIDFCRRTRDRGGRVFYLPSMKYVHLGGFNPSRFADLVAGQRRYVDKHIHGAHWLMARGVLAAGCFSRLARAVLTAGWIRPGPARRELKTLARATRLASWGRSSAGRSRR
jgi:N-acetylglucosaminyl-diphospho-decaprenol L-rhamnosyltransferase